MDFWLDSKSNDKYSYKRTAVAELCQERRHRLIEDKAICRYRQGQRLE